MEHNTMRFVESAYKTSEFRTQNALKRLLFRRDDVHANAAFPQGCCDFETDETCADHHNLLGPGGLPGKHFAVRESAQVVKLRVRRTGDRDPDWIGPCRQQKRTKAVCLAILELDLLATDVD